METLKTYELGGLTNVSCSSLFRVYKYQRCFCRGWRWEESVKLKWVRTDCRAGEVWRGSVRRRCSSFEICPFCATVSHCISQRPLHPLKSVNAWVICMRRLLFCLEPRWLFRFNRGLINMGFFTHRDADITYESMFDLFFLFVASKGEASPSAACLIQS